VSQQQTVPALGFYIADPLTGALPGTGYAGLDDRRAQNPYDDETTPAGWAWKQIRNDQIVDFNLKCQKTLDPHVNTGWDDPCRQIPSQFLVSVLTKPEFRDHVPRHRVGLRGARINAVSRAYPWHQPTRDWVGAARVNAQRALDRKSANRAAEVRTERSKLNFSQRGREK
jgi:hypothetical protein